MRMLRACAVLAGTILLAAGCSAPQMKGTPFFTGEYEDRQGPPEDRVNLWPLLYYRDPALSVLWPFIEKTDDHVAARPLFSVYGLDGERPVYNVLWPLARYDTHTGRGRVFPYMWGKDYRSVFPLYWHFGEPLGKKGGMDAFFPFWIFSRHDPYYDVHALWPIVNVRRKPGSRGWRVWPVAGRYESGGRYYRFQAWPLAQQWSDPANGRAEHMLIPVYYYGNDAGDKTFVSLPYSRRRRADGSGWDLVPPLCYRSRDGDARRTITPLSYGYRSDTDVTFATWLGGYRRAGDRSWWAALPLLSGGAKSADSRSVWVGGPLAHYGRDGDRREQHVFPLYYHRRSPDGSIFVSPAWSAGRSGDRSWQLVPPFYYRLAAPEGVSHHVVPFYYWNERTETFLSPLWARWPGGTEGGVNAALPVLLTMLSQDPGRRDLWSLAGAVHWSWGREAGGRHVIPFFYQNPRTGAFVSPLAARWRTGEHSTVLIPPLLSWSTTEPGRRDLWLGGPLAHLSLGVNAGPSHVFPLYYRDPEAETVLSPLWARWEEDGFTHRAVPPLLSAYSTGDGRKRLNVLLGLFNQEWGNGGSSGHLLPLYRYEGDDAFYTPLFGWNRDKDDGFVYPLTPLVGRWRGKQPGGWLFPLFSWRKSRENGDLRGTFLWGTFERAADSGGSGIFPFYVYRKDGHVDSEPRAGVRYATYGTRFLSLPLCWYRNQVHVRPADPRDRSPDAARTRTRVKKNGAFPFWSYASREQDDTGRRTVDGRILLALYDYHRSSAPTGPEREGGDYTRARVLWRLWHYERRDDAVSVDVFPAITYDRRADSMKKVSFLWRFFRYERDEHGVDLDLLFLPVLRGSKEKDAGPAGGALTHLQTRASPTCSLNMLD
jgi:hypothetical protein